MNEERVTQLLAEWELYLRDTCKYPPAQVQAKLAHIRENVDAYLWPTPLPAPVLSAQTRHMAVTPPTVERVRPVVKRHHTVQPSEEALPVYNDIARDMAYFRSEALAHVIECVKAGAEYGLVGYCRQASVYGVLPLIVEQPGTLAETGEPMSIADGLEPACRTLFTRLYGTLLTCHSCQVAEIAVNAWAKVFQDGSAFRFAWTAGNWPQYVVTSVQRLILACQSRWDDKNGLYFDAAQVYVKQEDAAREWAQQVKQDWRKLYHKHHTERERHTRRRNDKLVQQYLNSIGE